MAKAGVQAGEITQEFRVTAETAAQYPAGTSVPPTAIFTVGEKVDVQGTSIGKGFAGTIKRHNFRSQRASTVTAVRTMCRVLSLWRKTLAACFPAKKCLVTWAMKPSPHKTWT